MKLELLTNATVVDDAIRFVASESEKPKKSGSKTEGSVVAGVDTEEDVTVTAIATNQVF